VDAPRTLEQRKADALAMLSAHHADVWVATASAEGAAHLVPLSFAWDGTRVIVALMASSATARNLDASKRARLAFGTTRDVLMVDARLVASTAVGEDAATTERYVAQADWDPRTSRAAYVYLSLEPRRMQVWRGANEIAGRTVMRAGEWLS